MSRKPLVDVEWIMRNIATTWHGEVRPEAMRAVLEEVVTKYEAALDGARTAGLDAAIADGETLDEWKERAWQAEKRIAQEVQLRFDIAADARQLRAENEVLRKRIAELETENAKHMEIAERCLARAAYNADLETSPRHETLAGYYRPKDDLEMVSRRIDKLADRVAELEREQREGQGTL